MDEFQIALMVVAINAAVLIVVFFAAYVFNRWARQPMKIPHPRNSEVERIEPCLNS